MFNLSFFFFTIWAQLIIVLIVRNIYYNDIELDRGKMIWHIFTEETSISAKIIFLMFISWVLMLATGPM